MRAYELNNTLVQDQGLTLGNLSQRVKKQKKRKNRASPDPLGGGNSTTVHQLSIEGSSVDRPPSITEGLNGSI